MRYVLQGNEKVWSLRLSDRTFISEKQKRFWLDYALRILSYREYGRFVPADQLGTDILDHVVWQLSLGAGHSVLGDLSPKRERIRNNEVFVHLKIQKMGEGDKDRLRDAIFKTISVDVDYDEFEDAVLRWCVKGRVRSPQNSWIERTYAARQSKIDKTQFRRIHDAMPKEAKQSMIASIRGRGKAVSLVDIRAHPGTVSKANFDMAVSRLSFVNGLSLPTDILNTTESAWRHRVTRRVSATRPSSFREFSEVDQIGLYGTYLHAMHPLFTDAIVEAFCDAVIRFKGFAERRVGAEIAAHAERVRQREALLRNILQTALDNPDMTMADGIAQHVTAREARSIIASIDMAGGYDEAILKEYSRSWFGYYRPMLRKMVGVVSLQARPSSTVLLDTALWFARGCEGDEPAFLSSSRHKIPYLKAKHAKLVWKEGEIDLEALEVYTALALQKAIQLRNVWVEGSRKYRDPATDVPSDFAARRDHYYSLIEQPRAPKGFTARIKREMERQVLALNDTLPSNDSVFLSPDRKWYLRKPDRKPEPTALVGLKQDLFANYSGVPFIDIFKEAALDTGFLREFKPLLTKTVLSRADINRHLTACIYGMGTNVGLASMAAATEGITEAQLRHIKDAFIDFENIEAANRVLVESILRVRDPHIWGEPGVTCASDSKQYPAWDHNPIAQKHLRYGTSGIMVYWHVERRSLCIFSRVKRVSTPEIAPMLYGILHHGIEDMDIETIFTDSHGQTEIGFAFCHLLGFDLAPRIKRIAHQTLFLPHESMRSGLGNIRPM